MSSQQRREGVLWVLCLHDFNYLIVGIKMINISPERSPRYKFLKFLFRRRAVCSRNFYHEDAFIGLFNLNI